MFMILYVLDQPPQLDALLEAWSAIGINGVTLIESTGLCRRNSKQKHIPMPYLYGPCSQYEEGNVTLLAIVEGQEMIQSCLHATERVVGDLDGPHTGVFAAWPLAVVKGVPSTPTRRGE